MTELGIDVIPNLDPTLRHRASPAQTKIVNSRGLGLFVDSPSPDFQLLSIRM